MGAESRSFRAPRRERSPRFPPPASAPKAPLRRQRRRSRYAIPAAAVSTPPASRPVATVAFASDSACTGSWPGPAVARSGSERPWPRARVDCSAPVAIAPKQTAPRTTRIETSTSRPGVVASRSRTQPARRPRGCHDADARALAPPRSQGLRASRLHQPPTWCDFQPRAMHVVITLVSSSTPRPGSGPVPCPAPPRPPWHVAPTPNLVVAAVRVVLLRVHHDQRQRRAGLAQSTAP